MFTGCFYGLPGLHSELRRRDSRSCSHSQDHLIPSLWMEILRLPEALGFARGPRLGMVTGEVGTLVACLQSLCAELAVQPTVSLRTTSAVLL